MLKLCDVSKKYKEKNALNHVSLTFRTGIYGLLGPNGAGKSTMMNIITGNLLPDNGYVAWKEKDIRTLGADYRSILGYAPQQQGLYDSFTGRRFLSYMAALKGISKKEMPGELARVLACVNMEEAADQAIGAYSGGMKQRLLIAQAIMGSPELIVLDEPTAGLDPKERVRKYKGPGRGQNNPGIHSRGIRHRAHCRRNYHDPLRKHHRSGHSGGAYGQI